MRFGASIVAVILFSAGALAAENANIALDAQIARFLTALEFGVEAKAAYTKAIADSDLDAQTVRALARISAKRYVELATPAFRSVVSLEEAREMADFYEADAMQAMLAEQKRSGSDAPVASDLAQAAAVQTFMASPAGRAARRVQETLATPEFAENFEVALQAELEKQ